MRVQRILSFIKIRKKKKASSVVSSPKIANVYLYCVPLALLLGFFHEPERLSISKIKLQLHSRPLFLYFANKLPETRSQLDHSASLGKGPVRRSGC